MIRRVGIAATAAGLILTGSLPGFAQPPASGVAFPSTEVPSTGLLHSGLLDLSRFDLRHSLTYAVSSGSNESSRSGGLWLTQIGYQVSDPLRLSVDLGATLNPGAEGPLVSEKNLFLHRLDLDYRPSDSFQLQIRYVNRPNGSNPVWNSGYGIGPALGSPGFSRPDPR